MPCVSIKVSLLSLDSALQLLLLVQNTFRSSNIFKNTNGFVDYIIMIHSSFSFCAVLKLECLFPDRTIFFLKKKKIFFKSINSVWQFLPPLASAGRLEFCHLWRLFLLLSLRQKADCCVSAQTQEAVQQGSTAFGYHSIMFLPIFPCDMFLWWGGEGFVFFFFLLLLFVKGLGKKNHFIKIINHLRSWESLNGYRMLFHCHMWLSKGTLCIVNKKKQKGCV